MLGVAFDHSRLVIGCEDTTVRVFDAELGEGFVDGEALRQAMRELNRRTQGAGVDFASGEGGPLDSAITFSRNVESLSSSASSARRQHGGERPVIGEFEVLRPRAGEHRVREVRVENRPSPVFCQRPVP